MLEAINNVKVTFCTTQEYNFLTSRLGTRASELFCPLVYKIKL